MFNKLYLNFIIVSLLIILNACGGGGSSGSTAKSTSTPAQPLSVIFEAYNNQYNGTNDAGAKIIDATPFNQRTIISVRLTNTLNYPIYGGVAFPLGGYPVWSNSEYLTKPVTVENPDIVGERIGRISYFSLGSTDVRFSKIVTSDWCGYYTRQNPLQPNQSCVSYISIDWAQNYDTTEFIDLPIGYGFTALNPDFPTWQDGISYSSFYPTDMNCKSQVNRCLPILKAPTKIGRWYVGEQGYDFVGNEVNAVITNTENDGDYLYFNYGQKIKVNYDINGVAQLDFNNNLTNCTNERCYINGLYYGTVIYQFNIKGLDIA